MPKILDRCHSRLMADPDFTPQEGKPKSESAYAVCVASLQRAGLLKKGSIELTEKGRSRETELMVAASAILATHGHLTFDDVEEALRDALIEKFQQLSPAGEPIGEVPYLVDVLYLESQVIYRYDGKYWKTPFIMNPDYTATVGVGIPVTQVWVEAVSECRWTAETGEALSGGFPIIAAVWSTAFVNDLPDRAFLYIEPGGKKDEDEKTTPRSSRHFPYRDADGTVDLPHLRNALARIPQSSLPEAVRERVARTARRIARANGIDAPETKAADASSPDGHHGEVPPYWLRFPLLSLAGRGAMCVTPLNAERGVAALMDGATRVEMLFDTRAPHRWTMPDAKRWLSRPFVCAGALQTEVVSNAPDLPGPVVDAIRKLKEHVPPLSPFVIRVRGKVGKFEAESGKVSFTPEFYRKFGSAFIGKPYYLGHKGFDSADYREKIGQVIHFEYPDGEDPRWYINVSEGQTAIRSQILEEQALGISAERTGASSIEGWSSQTEDRDGDGFLEPTQFHAGGLAMVRREAATGTQIDRIIHA